MKTPEKVSYIKGLMEGLALDETKPEVKILKEVVGVLEELAAANSALTEENIKLRDYVEELDWDLGDLEEFVYGDDEEDFDEFDGDDDDFDYEDEDFESEEE